LASHLNLILSRSLTLGNLSISVAYFGIQRKSAARYSLLAFPALAARTYKWRQLWPVPLILSLTPLFVDLAFVVERSFSVFVKIMGIHASHPRPIRGDDDRKRKVWFEKKVTISFQAQKICDTPISDANYRDSPRFIRNSQVLHDWVHECR
jgi:hypothetical protein